MHQTVSITDEALGAMTDWLTTRTPEAGGLLFGLRGTSIITRFEADRAGIVSGASYFPSRQISRTVRQIEKEGVLQMMGVAHSHPGRLTDPSGPDRDAFALALRENPHLACFFAPIITLNHAPGPQPEMSSTVLLEGGHRLTMHAALRRGEAVEVYRPPLRIIPVVEEIRRLAAALNEMGVHFDSVRHDTMELNGSAILTAVLATGRESLVFTFPPTWPESPPGLILTAGEDTATEPPVHWSMLRRPSLLDAFPAIRALCPPPAWPAPGTYQVT